MSARGFDTAPLTTGNLLAGMLELLASEWGETLGDASPLPGHEQQWEDWLTRHLSDIASAPLAAHHRRLWEWFEGLEVGKRQAAFVECWPRGGGKSTTVELATARAIIRASRSFILYVCATQDAADKHVQDIQATLESLGVGRQESVYGISKGWRQNYLRTENHVTVMGIGLDKNVRGLKVGGRRPDLIILDDIDDEADGPKAVLGKVDRLTRAVLGTRAPDCSVVFIQNLIHSGGVMARLKAGRTRILSDRLPYQEVPAILGLVTQEQRGADGNTRDIIVEGTPTWAGLDLAACQAKIDDDTLPAFLSESQHVMRQGGSVFFPEFLRLKDGKPWHCIGPVKIPKHWPAQGGLDYGTRAPFAFTLDRFGPRGERVTTREIYQAGKDSKQQAALVRALLIEEGLPLDTPIYGDSAMFPAAGEPKVGTWPCDDFFSAGLNLIPSKKGRVSGWNRMRRNMNATVPDVLAEVAPGEAPPVCPMWRIVESKCPNLVQQLDDAVSCKKRPEDIDEGCEDHALDAEQYNQRGGDDEAGESSEARAVREREEKLMPSWAKQEKRTDYA
jgi:hypothetical protein